MAMWMFEVTMCAIIAIGGLSLIVLTKLMEKWCEAKGIVLEDDGVDYEEE